MVIVKSYTNHHITSLDTQVTGAVIDAAEVASGRVLIHGSALLCLGTSAVNGQVGTSARAVGCRYVDTSTCALVHQLNSNAILVVYYPARVVSHQTGATCSLSCNHRDKVFNNQCS